MRTEFSGRRRRRTSSVLQLMLPIIAGLCLAHISSPDLAVAFVLSPPTASWAGLSSQLYSWGNEAPSSATSTAGYRARARMILSESPSAACRRALRRARRRPSPEGVSHQQHQGLKGAHQRDLDVRLTTFNLLAPCYKRMHAEVMPAVTEVTGSGLLASEAKSRQTSRESEFTELWKERAVQTVEFMQREMSSSDIICLQEFWFEPAYETIFRAALGEEYDFHTLRRTGSKSDGVAVLLRRGKWEVCSSVGLSLSAVGDRVALVMHLRAHRAVDNGAGAAGGLRGVGASSGATSEDVVLVNTHLAFPHHALDRANQMSQIKSVTAAVEGLIRDAGLPPMTPRVVVGDLNVEESDPVCRHLSLNGFRSAFASLHRGHRVVTHLNHRGEQLMVDHVFVKAPGFAGRRRGEADPSSLEIPGLVARMHEDINVEEAMLLPGGIETRSWCPRFELSDHRPLTVRLKFPSN